MTNVSRELKEPIHGMVAIGERIARESGEEHARARAGELCDLGNDPARHLRHLPKSK